MRTVIFDLDECVIHTSRTPNNEIIKEVYGNPSNIDLRGRVYSFNLEDYKSPKGSGRDMYIWGTVRPHFDEFLKFCNNYFDYICVWSAAQKDYVEEITNQIFNRIRVPDVVWSYDMVAEIDGGKNYHKPILKIINYMRSIGLDASIEHSVFIDDKEDNFISSPSNGIVIPRYEPTSDILSMKADDIRLLQIKLWLESSYIIQTEDIRLTNKSRIFSVYPSVLETNTFGSNMGMYSGLNTERNIVIHRFGIQI